MAIDAVIKSIQKIMRKDTGVDGDAQRISQLVWMIFLKIFDAKESDWELLDDSYTSVIPDGLRWSEWATNDEGITGEELIDFVNNTLFIKLKNLKPKNNKDIRTFVVKSVFEDSYNYMKSGTLLRQVINKLNEIDFDTQNDRHQFNDVYESILKDLQSAGNAGEFYTPHPVTQFMVDMINPKLGETILDFACGTGGFLVCSVEHLKKQLTNIEDMETFQRTIMGVEKKQLPYSLCMTNLILHDFNEPNIRHDNLLTYPTKDIKPTDKVDIILTNPPFGGDEEDGVESNFPAQFQTRETADLFMTLLMYKLKPTGRAAIVLPDGFLFGEGIKTLIKEKLLSEFNVHTIVRLPNGVFSPYADINTNLIFIEGGKATKEIWFYEMPLPDGYKKYTKTKPIQHVDFNSIKTWWNNPEENDFAWAVSLDEIKKRNYNLDIKNPNETAKDKEYTVDELISMIDASFKDSENMLQKIKEVMSDV